jgi:hypothetical protein
MLLASRHQPILECLYHALWKKSPNLTGSRRALTVFSKCFECPEEVEGDSRHGAYLPPHPARVRSWFSGQLFSNYFANLVCSPRFDMVVTENRGNID